jgi:chaperonin GroES
MMTTAPQEDPMTTPTPPFRPLYDHILVKPAKPEDMTPGGIWIPDIAKEARGLEGTVVAAGKGICNFRDGSWKDLDVKVGDVVILQSKFTGVDVEIDGVPHVVVRQAEIAAIVDA